MPSFGEKSTEQLKTCHPDLQLIFNAVVKSFDCSIMCGYRGYKEQMQAYNSKPQKSKLKYPDSKHNKIPSQAVDVVPYPIDWKNINRFYYFGGYVKRIAEELNIKIKWGGDWDSDTLTDDQTFMDLPHFELDLTED